MPAFDTLQLAHDLEKAFTSEQAEVLVQAFAAALTQDLPTKQDLKDIDDSLTREILSVRSDLKDVEGRLETKITQLETKIDTGLANLKVDMAKWITGALLINFFGIAGLVITLIKTIGH